MFRQNVIEGMLANPAYGGNRDMVGWKWIGFPGDPMRRGDVYEKYIFDPKKRYPYEHKPLGLETPAAKAAKNAAAGAPNVEPRAGNGAPMGGM